MNKDFTGSQHDPNLQSYIYGCWVDINENEAKGFFTNKILFHLIYAWWPKVSYAL